MAFYSRLKSVCAFNKCFLALRCNFHTSRNPHQSLLNTIYTKYIKKPTIDELKVNDDVPDNFELIYRNKMSKYLWWGQFTVLICGGIVLFSYASKGKVTSEKRQTLSWTEKSRSTKNEEFYFLTFFVLFIVAMQVIVGRIPIRIYKVPKTSKYIGIKYGPFLGNARFKFKKGEIFNVGQAEAPIPWSEYRYVITEKTQKKPVILFDYYFRNPADLNIMLNLQRDPDEDSEKH